MWSAIISVIEMTIQLRSGVKCPPTRRTLEGCQEQLLFVDVDRKPIVYGETTHLVSHMIQRCHEDKLVPVRPTELLVEEIAHPPQRRCLPCA